MTAFLGAVLVLWPLGLINEHDSTAAWWLERPLVYAVATAFLVGLIAVFGRFERPRRPAA
jgi:RsiW-degrading membrane proteinase PrsW (M82 family)